MLYIYPLFYILATGIDKQLQRLLKNEKSNFKMLSEAVKHLGGIPPLAVSADMMNTLPDEKVTAIDYSVHTACTYLAFIVVCRL